MREFELAVGGAGLGSARAISAHRKAGGEGGIAPLSKYAIVEKAPTDAFTRALVTSGRPT